MPRLPIRPRPLVALLLLLSSTAAGRADPIVTGSATLQGDGSYLYQYTVTNPSASGGSLPAVLYFSMSPANGVMGASADDLANIKQPPGWVLRSGWRTDYDLPPNGGPILAGQTGAFSFTSKWAPGLFTYSLSGPNYLGLDTTHGQLDLAGTGWGVSGAVVAPLQTAFVLHVPEPASALLLVTGGGLLLLRRWRRR